MSIFLLWALVIALIGWNIHQYLQITLRIDNTVELLLFDSRDRIDNLSKQIYKNNNIDMNELGLIKELAWTLFENDSKINKDAILLSDLSKDDLLYLNTQIINILLQREYERKG